MQKYDLEELRQQIANLEPLERAQILKYYPHLATPELDEEELPEGGYGEQNENRVGKKS